MDIKLNPIRRKKKTYGYQVKLPSEERRKLKNIKFLSEEKHKFS